MHKTHNKVLPCNFAYSIFLCLCQDSNQNDAFLFLHIFPMWEKDSASAEQVKAE